MKINEVVVHEIRRSPVNSNPNIPIGKSVSLKGQNYKWNGQNWVNVSQGTKVAPKDIQQELNNQFPKPEFENPKGEFKGPEDQPDVMTDPRTGETKPKQPTGGGSGGEQPQDAQESHTSWRVAAACALCSRGLCRP